MKKVFERKERALAFLVNEMNAKYFNKSLPCLIPHFTERLKARARFNPHGYCVVSNDNELSEFFVIEISPSMLNNTKYEICAELLMQMIVAFCELHGICITSNVGRYYSLTFKQFAESKGLRCSYDRIRGWGNVTPSEKFIDFTISHQGVILQGRTNT